MSYFIDRDGRGGRGGLSGLGDSVGAVTVTQTGPVLNTDSTPTLDPSQLTGGSEASELTLVPTTDNSDAALLANSEVINVTGKAPPLPKSLPTLSLGVGPLVNPLAPPATAGATNWTPVLILGGILTAMLLYSKSHAVKAAVKSAATGLGV